MDNNVDNLSLTENDVLEIDLYELMGFFLDKIKIILAAFLIGAVLMFGLTYFVLPKTYQSTATMYIVSSGSNSYIDLTDLNLGDSLASDYERLIVKRPVLSKVIENLKLDMTEDELRGMLTIVNPANTRFLEITVTARDPKLSSKIANEMMDVSIDYIPETMDTVPPNIVEEALPKGIKSGPNFKKNTVLGALVGLLAALVFLTIQFFRDDTFKTEEDVEKVCGLTVLTNVPDHEIFENDR